MPAISPAHRIEPSPGVRAILEADSPKAAFLQHFLRYLEALLAPDPAGLDLVVTPDSRCHELEAIGFPRGPEGLKMFRRQVNAAIPDEHIFISAVRFEGGDVIIRQRALTEFRSIAVPPSRNLASGTSSWVNPLMRNQIPDGSRIAGPHAAGGWTHGDRTFGIRSDCRTR